jgi:hypothetical protein
VCCVLIGVSPYKCSPYLVPLPPGDDPIAVTVIIIKSFAFKRVDEIACFEQKLGVAVSEWNATRRDLRSLLLLMLIYWAEGEGCIQPRE